MLVRTIKDDAKRYRLTVTAKLQWLRGNSSPYFSITGDGRDHGSEFGGCCHDEILKHWPDLKPLVDIHLSDINGAPTHASANGWYWLAGALGGAGERYHGGNSKGHFGGQYREPTPDECLEVFARYCRISIADAQAIRAACQAKYNWPDMRALWHEHCEAMRPRWLEEANAVISQFNLTRPQKPE